MKRVFVAAALAGDVREALRDTQDRLRSALRASDVAWTRPDSWHLTLRFIGGVAESELPALQSAMAAACARCRAVPVVCERLGCFPDPSAPRVVWAGVTESRDPWESAQVDAPAIADRNPGGDPGGGSSASRSALANLASQLKEATAPWAGRDDRGPSGFIGHVTLARVRRMGRPEREALRHGMEEATERVYGRWTIGEVELLESIPGAGGSRYVSLAAFPLKRAG